jgi:hypothetical protein
MKLIPDDEAHRQLNEAKEKTAIEAPAATPETTAPTP